MWPTLGGSPDDELMILVHQETGWVDELKDYLLKGLLPEEDAEAERVAR